MDRIPEVKRTGPFWRLDFGHILSLAMMAMMTGVVTFFVTMDHNIENLVGTTREHEVRLTALERTLDAQDKRFQAYTESMHREFTAYQEANRADLGAIKDLIANIRVLVAEQAKHR